MNIFIRMQSYLQYSKQPIPFLLTFVYLLRKLPNVHFITKSAGLLTFCSKTTLPQGPPCKISVFVSKISQSRMCSFIWMNISRLTPITIRTCKKSLCHILPKLIFSILKGYLWLSDMSSFTMQKTMSGSVFWHPNMPESHKSRQQTTVFQPDKPALRHLRFLFLWFSPTKHKWQIVRQIRFRLSQRHPRKSPQPIPYRLTHANRQPSRLNTNLTMMKFVGMAMQYTGTGASALLTPNQMKRFSRQICRK